MLETVTRYVEGMPGVRAGHDLRRILLPFADCFSSVALTSAGLVINAGGATVPKIGASDFYCLANGVLVKIAAGTALPALTVVAADAGMYQVACYYVDAAGTVTVSGGYQGATIGTVKFPQFPIRKALIGFLLITYASPFVGGTTPLDTATTLYFSPVGALDPTVLP